MTTTSSVLPYLHLLQPPPNLLLLPTPTLLRFRNGYHHVSLPLHPIPSSLRTKPRRKALFALAESDSPRSPDPDPRTLLQELADSFTLPEDYFSKLPRDLRLDLNDAAFDLSNGPVKDEGWKQLLGYPFNVSISECGQELGEILLNISRAWELVDTSTSATLMRKLPGIVNSLSDNNISAMGKRLISAGRRFQSMGAYGGGEPEKIAKVMIRAGKFLSARTAGKSANVEPKVETRTLKFGELQVEITPDKAFAGAVIGAVFGTVSWIISRGIQSIPESSLQYANDNDLLLPKSLREALLVLFYSSTVLSAFASIGLVLLGAQLGSKEK